MPPVAPAHPGLCRALSSVRQAGQSGRLPSLPLDLALSRRVWALPWGRGHQEGRDGNWAGRGRGEPCSWPSQGALQPVSLEPSQGAGALGALKGEVSMPLPPYGSHLPPSDV